MSDKPPADDSFLQVDTKGVRLTWKKALTSALVWRGAIFAAIAGVGWLVIYMANGVVTQARPIIAAEVRENMGSVVSNTVVELRPHIEAQTRAAAETVLRSIEDKYVRKDVNEQAHARITDRIMELREAQGRIWDRVNRMESRTASGTNSFKEQP